MGPAVVCNDPPVPPTNRYGRGPNRQVGPTKHRQPRDRRCFNCGKVGHIARNCDQVRLSKPSDPYVPFVENVNSVRANGKNPRNVYLEVLVDG